MHMNLWAMKLLTDENVKDFTLFTNLNGLDAFDDVVIFVEYKNNLSRTYLIQSKHRDNKNLTINQLLNEQGGDFSIKKYEEGFKKIEDVFEKDDINKDIDVWFVLCTDCPFKYDNNIETNAILFVGDDSEEHVFLNTNEEVHPQKIKNNFSHFSPNFLEHFLLFVKQIPPDKIKFFITELLKGKLSSVETNTAPTILEFFNDWALEKNSSWLYKSDIEMKLLETVISPFITFPKNENVTMVEQCSLWNDVLLNYDVTVLPNEEDIITTVAAATTWKMKATEIWQLHQIGSLSTDNRYKMIIFRRKGYRPKIGINDVYLMLWELIEVPLLVRCLDKETFVRVKNVLNVCNKTVRKFIIFYGSHGDTDFRDSYRVFSSLKKLPNNKLKDILDRLKISLQGRTSYLHIALQDETLVEFITPKIFFMIAFDMLVVGEKLTSNEYVVDRYFKKILVHINILNEVSNMFVILGNEFRSEMCHQFMKLAPSGRIRFFAAREISLDKIEQIIKKLNTKNPVHFLATLPNHIDTAFLEWRFSTKNVEVVSKHMISFDDADWLNQRNEFCIEANKAMEYFISPVTIFNGVAGIGKSVATKYVASCCDANKWLVYIDLYKYQKYIQHSDWQTNDIVKMLDPFLGFTDMSNEIKTFLRAVFEQKLKSKQVFFVLDEYDHTNDSKVNVFVDTLYSLQNKLWITTKLFNKKHLEERLFSVSIEVTGFDQADQRKVLENTLLKKGMKYSIDELNSALSDVKNSFNFYGEEILRFPFLINMIAEIILAEGLEYFSSKKLNLIDLYEKTVSYKVQSKSKIITLQKIALASIFPEKHLRKFIKWNEFSLQQEDLIGEDDSRNNIFIIKGLNDEGQPQFIHQFYAEYLAAAYLVNNIEEEIDNEGFKFILEELIKFEKSSVKQFFDMLIIKELPLHEAILNGDLEKVEWSFGKDDMNSLLTNKDKCGRTPLHLAASYGTCFVYDLENSDYDDSSSRIRLFGSPVSHSRKNGDHIFMHLLKKSSSNSKELFNCRDILGYNIYDYAYRSGCLISLNNLLCGDSLFEIKYVNSLFLHHCLSNGFNNILRKLEFGCLCRVTCNNETLLSLAFTYCDMEICEKVTDKELIYCNYKYNSLHEMINRNNLLTAVCRRTDDISTNLLKFLIDKGACVNWAGELTRSPLLVATEFGNLECIKVLLANNFSVNAVDILGKSALHLACIKRNYDCFNELLNHHKVKIDKSDTSGKTVLHYAAISGDTVILSKLLDKKAKIDKQDNSGNTPLMLAAQHINIECVTDLLNHGASISKVNNDGRNALMLALCGFNSSSFISFKPVIELHIEIKTQILYAEEKVLQLVQLFLEKGIPINKTDKHGNSVMTLVPYNYESVVNELLTYKAPVRYVNQIGSTALTYALKNRSENFALKLLERGVPADGKSKDGKTNLMWAIEHCYKTVVDKLLEKNCLVNEKTALGQTALMYCVFYHLEDYIQKLLDHGAHIDESDISGNPALMVAVLLDREKCVFELLRNHASVNKTNNNGDTVLLIEIKKCSLKYVPSLLDAGADLKITDSFGNTPLMLAIATGLKELVFHLLSVEDTNVNTFNRNKETALMFAADVGDSEIINKLVEKGAECNAVNKNGETAYSLALRRGHMDCLEKLKVQDDTGSHQNGHTEEDDTQDMTEINGIEI